MAVTVSFHGSRMPMSDQGFAEGPLRKVQRAEQLIRSIEQGIEAFSRTDWCVVNLTRKPNGNYDLRFEFHSLPNDVATEVGDAIHNLRAALDLLAVALVRRAGASVKNVRFPFADSDATLEKAITWAKFHRASHEDKVILRSLRPYKGGNVLLRALQDLDIQDKHRALIPVVNSVSTPTVRVRPETNVSPFGDLIAELDASEPPALRVCLPQGGPLGGAEIVPALWKLHESVADAISAFCGN